MSGRTALFDLDGVLLQGDSTVELLRRRLARAPWLGAGVLPAGAVFALADRAPGVRSAAARAVVAAALAGRRLADVEDELRALALDLRADPARLHPRVLDALHEHVAAGDRVLVTSAGLEPFVRAWVDGLVGEGVVEVAASRLAQARTGVVMSDHHHGVRKLEVAGERGYATPFDHVYSDSVADLPLLREARQPVLVRPSAGTLVRLPADLRARAEIWT